MKNYKEFKVTSDPFLPEILSGILWELNITGINEEDNFLKVFADDNGTIDKSDISKQLAKLVSEKIINSFTIDEQTLEEKNWNEEWEKGLNVIHISDKIVIKPTFREYSPKANQIVIEIDPKMSFGTGEHQTTRLMLNFLEKYIYEGCKIFDVGSGTGVLAIAAIKLGASSAIAVDNDDWCYVNGKENASLNSADDKIEFKIGEISDVEDSGFDIVAANIQKNILMEIAGKLSSKTKKGGMLLLSGLLQNDEADIKEKYISSGMKFIEKTSLGEWIALVFEKN